MAKSKKHQNEQLVRRSIKDKLKLFVIMPFDESLSDFYRIIKKHIETFYNIICIQADEKYKSSKAFLDNIQNLIARADIILADCSENDSSVFDGITIAQFSCQKIVLISSNSIEKIPSNLREHHFIRYELDNLRPFLVKLDNVLYDILKKNFVSKKKPPNSLEASLEKGMREKKKERDLWILLETEMERKFAELRTQIAETSLQAQINSLEKRLTDFQNQMNRMNEQVIALQTRVNQKISFQDQIKGIWKVIAVLIALSSVASLILTILQIFGKI